MVRPLPQIETGVPIYELLCLGSGSTSRVQLSSSDGTAPVGPDRAAAVTAAIARTVSRPKRRQLRDLYSLVAEDRPVFHAEELITRLREERLDTERLRALGRWLAVRSVRPGPVGVGICVLGASGFGDAADIAACLGAHPPFTDIAIAAAKVGAADSDEFIWNLAEATSGPQRMSCLEGLRGTDRRDIKDWVLRAAWPADASAEPALLAADIGELHVALDDAGVEAALLDRTARLLRMLSAPGAKPDLTDLPSGPAVVMAYLRHVGRRRLIDDFLAVASVERFLLMAGDRIRLAWGAEARAEVIGRCSAVASHEAWTAVLADSLATMHGLDFAVVAAAADARGIDTFPHRLARLEADHSGASWRLAFENADRLRARRLAAIATRSLRAAPEKPGADAGTVWAALDSMLQCLADHPGVGGEVVLLGLSSGVSQRRAAALRTLRTWDRETWPDAALDVVARLAEEDTDPAVLTIAKTLLAG